MTQKDKLAGKLTNRAADCTWTFSEVERMLRMLGYRLDRSKGSHHIYAREDGVDEFVLPRHGSKVKPHYIRKLREKLTDEKTNS